MTNYDKLIHTLKEVFMLDKANLNFGIYRIMNEKRKDIGQFLEVDLVPQVQKVLAESLSIDKQAIQKELDDTIKQALGIGADPESLPKVHALRARLGEAADMVGIENEVFSLLANFFKRYFDNGDFISMRRYKKDVYAIPYEGEEVKLHWANADQYYIKTSEYFKVYRFKLGSAKTVVFELVKASTEPNNNKAQGDKERRFAIQKENPCEIAGDEFKIYFTYEPTDKGVKQNDLLQEAFNIVKGQIPKEFLDLLSLRPTEKDKTRTLLQKHLMDYTAKNTFDYFIHKDLGGFLTRELDFYIKNEVLFIDDLNTRDEQEFLKQLSKIKAIKKIGEKIIAFLAQLENFQKKLWLKKKMVVECHYCFTLDRVPKELYPEIISNQAQIDEWIKLFAIDEIKGQKAKDMFSKDLIGFSNPLSLEFLNQNQFLVLDTAFFSESFKLKLIASIENFDEQCDGLLINSENFQALNLLQKRFNRQVNCIYIDPPYNTGDDGFNYKDNFKSSSWLSMMDQLSEYYLDILVEDGVFFASCDEHEALDFGQLLKNHFGGENLVETITWNKRIPKNDKGIGNIHEYIYLFSKNQKLRNSNEKSFHMRKEAVEEINLLVESFKKKKIGILETQLELKKYYKKQGYDRGITLYCEIDPNYKIWGKINMSWPNAKTVGPRYDVINPITNKPCPVPDKGWRWKEETFRDAEKDGPTFNLPDGNLIKGRIWFSKNEKIQPSSITYLHEVESFLLRSIISIKSDGSLQLENLGLAGTIDYPKPVQLIDRLFYSTREDKGLFLDFFAGSGTSSEAIIKLNNFDNGKRKYILIDMGGHFNYALLPRTQKNIYSKDWKDGIPVSREGISHCFKYMRLESYEDTLNNLQLTRTNTQELAINSNPKFKEGYMLHYMLDVESQGSLLNLDWFINPFECHLQITKNNELVPTKVDLVETFNYLIGLVVESYAVPKDGYVVVTGKNLAGESILVVWRDCTKHDNVGLNIFLEKSKYNPLDGEFDRIFVNGDNNVENLKTGDERWKVVLIEEEFKKRMFENS